MVEIAETIDPSWISSLANLIVDDLGACPRSGGGVHHYIFRAATWLQNTCNEDTACAVIARLTANCGRDVTEREIKSAVTIGFKTDPAAVVRKWPQKNQPRINEIARTGITLAQLEALSPVKPDTLPAWKIVDTIYPGDPKLCFAPDEKTFATRRKAHHLMAAGSMQCIVPNAMKRCTGTTLEGHRSERSKDNVGERQFIIIENDPVRWEDLPEAGRAAFESEVNYKRVKRDEAAAILWHLAQIDPRFALLLVVDSAGKSLHGWVPCRNVPEEELLRFFRYAVSLGADKMLWNPAQLVRMPGGRRPDGRIQRVVYFNPQALEVQ